MHTEKKENTKITNMADLQHRIRGSIQLGNNTVEIVKILSDVFSDKILLQECVERTVEEYPDYELIQFFMKSKIVVDREGEDDKIYLYNSVENKIITITSSKLNAMISRKLKWDHRRYTCQFTYDPYNRQKLFSNDNQWNFNTYEPPFWYEDSFYTGKEQEDNISEIPKIYERFFKHLVNNDKPSYEYVLNWLANMLQARNYCMLTTIGNQGIGKGVLGDIMRNLVGESNYSKTDKKIFTKDFNNQAANVRLLYVNEFKITNVDQENKLKALIDDTIEIEAKGKDAKLQNNYASIYLSSNNMDCVRLSKDDRRFSIIELTENKLVNVLEKEEIEDLLKPSNIRDLALYLMQRQFDDKEMMKVFTSTRTELIRSNSYNQWHEWLVDEFIPENLGKVIPVKELTNIVAEECDLNRGPSRRKFQEFEQMYGKIKVKNKKIDNKQVWSVKILENDNE